MPSHETRNADLPASGPKLADAIDQALAQLSAIAKLHDFDHPSKGWPPNPKIWREILTQSREKMSDGVAPNLPKGMIAWPIGVQLTGRQWDSFQKWYKRSIKHELIRTCAQSGAKALRAVRIADRTGGRPEQSEAVFFLAYLDEDATPRILQAAKIASISSASVHGSDDRSVKQTNAISKLGVVPDQTVSVAFAATLDSPERASSGEDQSIDPDISARPDENSASEPKPADHLSERASIRWRFGLSMVLLGLFLLIFCIFLPPDSRRVMFVIFSFVLLGLGLWDMDYGNKGIPR